jgi:hypothetical protein
VAQTLDYLTWVAALTDTEVRDAAARTNGVSFHEAYQRRFGPVNPPEQLNSDQRMLIVATDVDDATARIVEHLTRRYGVDINVVALSYFLVGEREVLVRTWIVDPMELEDRVDSRPSEPAGDADRSWTGAWHVNTGVHADGGVFRNWEDERHFNFLSAGQGARWRDEIMKLHVGDRVFAYLNGAGYVGGGIVASMATRADKFTPFGFDRPLKELPLASQGWFVNSSDDDLAEYMVGVQWSKTVDPSEGVRTSPALRGTVRKIRSPDLGQTLLAAFS